MPKEFSRTRRIADQIQRDLSQLIRDEIKDPRLGMFTVQSVEVSRDLSHAKVYISVMGDEQVRIDTLAVLTRAAGYLRKLLGKEMRLRIIPQLHFIHDDSLDRGLHMSSLIAKAVAEDASHHQAAGGDGPDTAAHDSTEHDSTEPGSTEDDGPDSDGPDGN